MHTQRKGFYDDLDILTVNDFLYLFQYISLLKSILGVTAKEERPLCRWKDCRKAVKEGNAQGRGAYSCWLFPTLTTTELVFNMKTLFSNSYKPVSLKSVWLHQFTQSEDLALRPLFVWDILLQTVSSSQITHHHRSLIWAEMISSHWPSMSCN